MDLCQILFQLLQNRVKIWPILSFKQQRQNDEDTVGDWKDELGSQPLNNHDKPDNQS